MRGILVRLGKNLIKIAVVFLAIFYSIQVAYASPIAPKEIIELNNQIRIQNGLNPLSKSIELTIAAQKKATDLVNKNYWSHQTPEGKPFWVFVDKREYNWSHLGENLAADFVSAEGITNAWYNSELHRKNILGQNYQDIGVGISGNVVAVLYGTKSKSQIIHTLSNNIITIAFKLLDIFSF